MSNTCYSSQHPKKAMSERDEVGLAAALSPGREGKRGGGEVAYNVGQVRPRGAYLCFEGGGVDGHFED